MRDSDRGGQVRAKLVRRVSGYHGLYIRRDKAGSGANTDGRGLTNLSNPSRPKGEKFVERHARSVAKSPDPYRLLHSQSDGGVNRIIAYLGACFQGFTIYSLIR
jgi:hypothetical protein